LQSNSFPLDVALNCVISLKVQLCSTGRAVNYRDKRFVYRQVSAFSNHIADMLINVRPMQTRVRLNVSTFTETLIRTTTLVLFSVCCSSSLIGKWHTFVTVVAHGTVIEAVCFLYWDMQFSTCRPRKTNKYFVTKLGRRDYVGKLYTLIKYGEDRLQNVASTW